MVRLNTNDLKFRILDSPHFTEEERKERGYEEKIFQAYYNDIRVGELFVGRQNDIGLTESERNFFLDSLDPSKSRPFTCNAYVEPEFRGNGIAGALKTYANKFYKENHGTNLHSAFSRTLDAERSWTKLAREGKAVAYPFFVSMNPPNFEVIWKML